MTKNGGAPRRALVAKFAGTPPMRKPGLQAGVLENPRQQRRGGGLAVGTGHRQHPAVPEHLAREPLRPRHVRQGALQQRLDHRLPARHDIAHHHHIRRRGELRGVEACGDGDAERLELGAHGRIDVAIGAGDAKARSAGERGDAAHERAADAQNVDVAG